MAEAFRTSWDKVFDAVEHVVTWGLEHRTLGQIDAIGVDEIRYSKGHKYLTLVYQIDIGVTRLLWVGKERTTESFEGSSPPWAGRLFPRFVSSAPTCGNRT
jgi:transposase